MPPRDDAQRRPNDFEITDNYFGAWLDAAIEEVPGARVVVLGSMDGIGRAHSKRISRQDAERLAAAASSCVALATSQSELASGKPGEPWVKCVFEYGTSWLMVIAAADGSYLAATAGRDVDMGMWSYVLDDLVSRIGGEIASPARIEAVPSK